MLGGKGVSVGENLIAGALDIDIIDTEKIRSRLKEFSASIDDVFSISGDPMPEHERLMEEFDRNLLVLSGDHDVQALESADSEAYIEQLKKDLKSTEEENVKLSEENETIQTQVLLDSSKLGGVIDALSSVLNFIDSKDVLSAQSSIPTERPISGHALGRQRRASVDYEIKVLELSQQIDECKSSLSTLEELDNVFKRLETTCSLEDLFCGVKCIQFENNCIRLSLKTLIPSMDFSRPNKKLYSFSDPTNLDHELLIEVTDKMELENIEIFPGDVHLDEIINAVKSSRFLPVRVVEDTLGWLIRQIQQRIILCNLRRLSVKHASNSSGRSIVYSDPDETVTTHVQGGLVASVKIPQGWPLSSYPLMLWSLKPSESHYKSIPWSLLCKVQEQANSLDIQKRHDLINFVDAIELLVMEKQAKYSNNNASF